MQLEKAKWEGDDSQDSEAFVKHEAIEQRVATKHPDDLAAAFILTSGCRGLQASVEGWASGNDHAMDKEGFHATVVVDEAQADVGVDTMLICSDQMHSESQDRGLQVQRLCLKVWERGVSVALVHGLWLLPGEIT